MDVRLHHVGIVVADIRATIEGYLKSFGASWDGRIFQDPLQKVQVTFFRTSRPGDALIELVEPAAKDSPVRAFLQKGGGFHHLCYEVNDLDAQLKEMHSHGGVIAKRPLPAVAFENRRIAWVFTREKLLLEFLESNGDESRA